MTDPDRRGRGLAAGLTRESVLAAAERVVERVGFGGASVRGVAIELEVTPGALYHHFRNKQELLDAVADEFLAREVLRRLPHEAAPLERIRWLCRRLHAAGRAHPAMLTSVFGHLSERVDSSQMEAADELLKALREAGVDPKELGVYYRALVSICLGNALYDANLASVEPAEAERLLTLHAQESPYSEIRDYVRAMPKPSGEGWLDRELDLILSPLLP